MRKWRTSLNEKYSQCCSFKSRKNVDKYILILPKWHQCIKRLAAGSIQHSSHPIVNPHTPTLTPITPAENLLSSSIVQVQCRSMPSALMLDSNQYQQNSANGEVLILERTQVCTISLPTAITSVLSKIPSTEYCVRAMFTLFHPFDLLIPV